MCIRDRFTPDHITEFMCRITGVDRTKRILDATCGSGSFLVQAMVKELADCRRGKTEDEANSLMEKVRKEHIYGIEVEEKAYVLSTTNMPVSYTHLPPTISFAIIGFADSEQMCVMFHFV